MTTLMPNFDDRFFEDKKLLAMREQEEESLLKSLALQYGYQYVNLRGITINPEALLTIKETTAVTAELVAFEKLNNKLSVALRNPNNPNTKKVLVDLEKKWEVNIFMCSKRSLEHAWKRYADQKQTTAVKKGVLDIDPEEIVNLQKRLTTQEKVAEKISEIRTLNSARRVSETLEVMFAGALGLKASDIHIEPEESDVRIRYRLDGVLHDVVDIEQKVYRRLISRIKLLAGVKLNIHDEAQDGRFTFDIIEKEIEVRTSIIPGSGGESVVMRLLDPTVASFNMDQLGLNKKIYEVMAKELKKPNGMIITTGPTGSGKTTALYAFLRKAHTSEVKIITIEDPVEYKVDNIVQTQVGDDYTFASGLRAILRQDPDIIMVGEIRDREVAETAIHAAQTGHLVFSTLHTNSAAGAFPRLIDLGVNSRVMGGAMNIVMGQRLVRKLCENCRRTRVANEEEVALIKNILKKHPTPPALEAELKLYEPVGCEVCQHTGYEGRQGIYEAIQITEKVEDAILRDPREHQILEAAREQKIPTMLEDGIEKVLAGITSLEELERVIDIRKTHSSDDSEETEDNFSKHVV